MLFTGIGPLLAWGRLSAEARAAGARSGRRSRPASRRWLLALLTDAADSPWALFLFAFAAFTLVALWPGVLARRVGRGGRSPASRCRRRCRARSRRNRRRYGGYVVHVGIAILLIGIAASSSFQTNRDLRLDVGESATVGDYEVTYEGLDADPENERIAFAATLDVRKDGEQFALLAPARNYYPTQDPMAGPIGRYFEGEATSEIGLTLGRRRGLLGRVPARPLDARRRDRPRQPPARRTSRPTPRGSRSWRWPRSTPPTRRPPPSA